MQRVGGSHGLPFSVTEPLSINRDKEEKLYVVRPRGGGEVLFGELVLSVESE